MPPSKPNYTALTPQVVRKSREPLPFAEIMRRVNTLAPVTTRNPKGQPMGSEPHSPVVPCWVGPCLRSDPSGVLSCQSLIRGQTVA
jgi:hypothetical protein